MTLLTLVIIAFALTCSLADDSKPNVVVAKSHCYVAVQSPLAWGAAENDCASNGGHLASVESEDVSKALHGLNSSSSLWIGAAYDSLTERWRWSDATPFEFTKWKQGHPANQASMCSVLNPDSGEWTSNDCGSPLHYVCRLPLNNSSKFCEGLVDPDSPKVSTDKWDPVDGISGKVFLVEDAKPTWSDAQQSCIRLGGDLASIESEEQNRLLSQYVVRKGFPKQDGQRVAIGISRKNEESSWIRTDGNPFQYMNGRLDNQRDEVWGATDCVYLYLKGGAPYGWRNDFCVPPADAFGPPAALCERKA